MKYYILTSILFSGNIFFAIMNYIVVLVNLFRGNLLGCIFPLIVGIILTYQAVVYSSFAVNRRILKRHLYKIKIWFKS